MRPLTLLLCLALSATAAATPRDFGLWLGGDRALRLVRHDVQVSIQHPLAETIITQEFENPTALDNLEAFFHYPVPRGATVNGLALWVNGQRREARMLERQQACEIYQGIVDEKRDPALVERLDGNIFRIRIFPIAARSRQRVELRFIQPVEQCSPTSWRYVLPRPPGQPIHVLRLGAQIAAPFELAQATLLGLGRPRALNQQGSRWLLPRPSAPQSFAGDLQLRYQTRQARRPPTAAVTVKDGQRYFVAELPRAESGGQRARRVALLLDSSASTASQRQLTHAAASQLLAALTPEDLAAVIPFGLLPPHPVMLQPLSSRARARAQQLIASAEAQGAPPLSPRSRRPQTLARGSWC